LAKVVDVKKSIVLVLDDEQLIELKRILMDEDAGAALGFLNRHLRVKTAALLDGRPKVKVNVRGSDSAEDGENRSKME
jgi:hypothetical protein